MPLNLFVTNEEDSCLGRILRVQGGESLLQFLFPRDEAEINQILFQEVELVQLSYQILETNSVLGKIHHSLLVHGGLIHNLWLRIAEINGLSRNLDS